MRRCIALSLSCRPYASSYMILDYLPKPEENSNAKYMQMPSQLLYDKIDAAIICNENASDWELNDFIVASGGQIVEILQKELDKKAQDVGD